MGDAFVAIDLGAGSGRVIVGRFDNTGLEQEVVHRFPNDAAPSAEHERWNTTALFDEIKTGLEKAAGTGEHIRSVGVDTWGVDYGLLDARGCLLGLPFQYRDPRTEGMGAKTEELYGNAKIYSETGIMPFFLNTSHQLLADHLRGSAALKNASTFLMIPDLLAFWLTGRAAVERTNASTTQLFSPETNDWAWSVIEGLGLPTEIFGEVVPPGTVLGNLRSELAEELGDDFPVIATASHDTAAAVAGIPGEGSYAFISSGTWSILGTEISEPILTEEARTTGFANELGVENTVRFLKNISGLWLIQECKREWEKEGANFGYDALAALANEAPPFTAFVDADTPEFESSGDMPNKIRAFCKRTGQPVPENRGTVLRVATESIALKHRTRFEDLKRLTGLNLDRIHMGGGGIQNDLLTQAIADACGVPVHAGPIEATACGNLITQMTATGELPDIAAGRALIRDSLPLKIFSPADPTPWDEAAARFDALQAST
jgi:rhamnulokinase